MSETEEPTPSKKSKAGGQPLPRLWKTEPEEDDGEIPLEPERPGADRPAKKVSGDTELAPSKKSSSKSKAPASKSQKSKSPAPEEDNKGKKVLVEETPALDTVESRQRARMIMGALIVICVLLPCWITYRVFLYDPSPIQVTDDNGAAAEGSPEIRPNPDQEARFMFNQAHDQAKHGQTDHAIALLNKVVTVYKGTQTAADAKAALDRPKHNLPLFVDRPTVVAEPKPSEPPPSETPPPIAVVTAEPVHTQPTQGNATLVLPPNPSEMIVAPPSLRDKIESARANSITPRALPKGFRSKLEAGVHESGWPLVIVGDRDGALMVLVPSDSFTMGNDDGQPSEAPAHGVRLSTYYVDQHEVTNRQFRLFLNESHYRGQPPGKWLTDDKARAESESLPVVMVNAHDALAFAEWAGKQLPTEAQWEMAARSSDNRRYPWGNEPIKGSRPRVLHEIEPKMSFADDHSPYGAFDMAGNVEEWTRDWYDSKYFRSLAGHVTDNPTGPSTRPRSSLQPQLVVKGGSKSWSLTHREGVPVEKRLPYLGFRCVLAVETAIAGAPSTPSAAPGSPKPANRGATDIPF
jgi:formylglycine-generating enzyme